MNLSQEVGDRGGDIGVNWLLGDLWGGSMEKKYLIIITIVTIFSIVIIGIGFLRHVDNTVSEFQTINFLPEIYTVTLVDNMGITKNFQIVYNVYNVEYAINGKDLFGNEKYIIKLCYLDSNASQFSMVYYDVNEFTFVSQDVVLVDRHGIPTDKRLKVL